MNKDLVKKYHLEECVKRFGMINEYIYETFDEADDKDSEQPEDNVDDDIETSDETTEEFGGDDMDFEDDSDDMSELDDLDMDNDDVDMEGEGMPDEDSDFSEDDDFDEEDSFPDVDTMEDGDEVIDVDDLTKSQDATSYKIDGVDEKLTQLLQIVDKFENALNINDRKIEDMKKELEMRNPTPTERLNLRSLSSYPYNVQPNGYWEKFSKEHPEYEIDIDNKAPEDEDKEYILRKGDIKGGDDRSIARSFNQYKVSDFINF